MVDEHRTLAERLLELEQYDSPFRNKYEQEIKAMLEHQLTPFRKFMFGVTTVFGSASAAVCGWLAAVEDLPPLARGGLAVGSLFGIAWAVMAVSVLRRGKIMVTDCSRMAAMVWVFTVLMVVFFMLIAGTMEDTSRGILMVANGLVFLIFAAVYLLGYRVSAAELATRQKLLEIELRLAELAEK